MVTIRTDVPAQSTKGPTGADHARSCLLLGANCLPLTSIATPGHLDSTADPVAGSK